MSKRYKNIFLILWFVIVISVFVLLVNDTALFERHALLLMILYFMIAVGIGLFYSSWLAMHLFMFRYKVTLAQQHLLSYAGLLLYMNDETEKTLLFSKITKHESKNSILKEWWDIGDKEALRKRIEQTVIADYDTDFVSEVHEKLIQLGISEIDESSRLLSLKVNNAVQQKRIQRGLQSFQKMRHELIQECGYSVSDISDITCFTAWDYGCSIFMAQTGVNSGYLSTEECWQSIEKAVQNIQKDYDSWRQYLAAFLLGKAIAYGYDRSSHKQIVFLLQDANSPFQRFAFDTFEPVVESKGEKKE